MKEIPLEVIEQASRGDRRSFEEIYKAASGFVYTLALRILRNQADAEEVTQEVFIRIHRSLKDFGFRSSFKTWLYRVTTNSAINAYRQKAKEQCRRMDFDTAVKTAQVQADPAEDLKKQDNQKLLSSLLNILSPEQRGCILLREIEGLSYREIADALKTNINTVRTRLKRARETLLASKKNEVIKNEL